MSNKLLAEISRAFFKQKHIVRYKMKKTAEMSDNEVVMYCHHYCEDNNLIDEWNQFRNRIECERCDCPYVQEYISMGLCYDMQMVAYGYIKALALPADIDKELLLNCCKDCVHRL